MLPFLRGMDLKKWGMCEDNQRDEFLQSFNRFNNDLIESIKNSKSEILLEIKPELLKLLKENQVLREFIKTNINEIINDKAKNEQLRNIVKTTKANITMLGLNELKETMNTWLNRMKDVSEENQSKDEENNEECGLRNEMDYWKHRYYKLNSIDEQLKSDDNQMVYKLLEFFINLSTHMNQERISNNLKEALKDISASKTELEDKQKEFKSFENELNRYLTEAKNNDKYLSQLDRYVEQLEQSRPRKVIDQLPLLLYSIRMI